LHLQRVRFGSFRLRSRGLSSNRLRDLLVRWWHRRPHRLRCRAVYSNQRDLIRCVLAASGGIDIETSYVASSRPLASTCRPVSFPTNCTNLVTVCIEPRTNCRPSIQTVTDFDTNCNEPRDLLGCAVGPSRYQLFPPLRCAFPLDSVPAEKP